MWKDVTEITTQFDVLGLKVSGPCLVKTGEGFYRTAARWGRIWICDATGDHIQVVKWQEISLVD